MDIFALLEEVAGLTAFIELHPELPFAHFAPRQAALAKHALETALVKEHTAIDNVNSINSINSIKILRTIAATATDVALVTAIDDGDVSLVWLLLESGLTVDAFNDRIFEFACQKGHLEIVRLLFDATRDGVRVFNPTAYNNSAFQTACMSGHTEIVRLLLDLVNLNGEYEGFRFACQEGHTEIVRLLLDFQLGRGIKFCANEGFRIASENGHAEIVRLLLDYEIDFYSLSVSLRRASGSGHTEVVRQLLTMALFKQNFAEIVESAFCYACLYGHTEIVHLFLKHGINPAHLATALRYASANGHAEICAILKGKIPWYKRVFL